MNPYIQDELFQKPENDEEERRGKSEKPELEIPEETEGLEQGFLPGLEPKKGFNFQEASRKALEEEGKQGIERNPPVSDDEDGKETHWSSVAAAHKKY